MKIIRIGTTIALLFGTSLNLSVVYAAKPPASDSQLDDNAKLEKLLEVLEQEKNEDAIFAKVILARWASKYGNAPVEDALYQKLSRKKISLLVIRERILMANLHALLGKPEHKEKFKNREYSYAEIARLYQLEYGRSLPKPNSSIIKRNFSYVPKLKREITLAMRVANMRILKQEKPDLFERVPESPRWTHERKQHLYLAKQKWIAKAYNQKFHDVDPAGLDQQRVSKVLRRMEELDKK